MGMHPSSLRAQHRFIPPLQVSVSRSLASAAVSPLRLASSAANASAKPLPTMRTPAMQPISAVAIREEDASLRGWLDAIGAGDSAMLSPFYDATIGRVYSIALRIVRTPASAEEVASDVYLQVWREAARYDATRGRVLGWLLTIARSRALDHLRRQDDAIVHPAPDTLVSNADAIERFTGDPQDLLIATQSGHALHTALRELSPVQRQLLALAFFRGLTHAEIVEQSGLPLGTVKTHIRRALTALRNVLERTPSEL